MSILNFKPIELNDKAVFDKYISLGNCNNSEASFANLYMWQSAWDIKMATLDDALFISMESDLYRFFLCPPFLRFDNISMAPYLDICDEYMMEKCGDVFLKGATIEMKKKIEDECPDKYDFIYDDVNAEYVYLVKDLIDLPGKKYHSKRNHISMLLRNYKPIMELYTPKYKEQCLDIQHKWAQEKQADPREAAEEFESIQRALNNYEKLGLIGCVVLIDGTVVAFSFAERICPYTVLIHIEKANSNYPGLFTYVNREFLANYWSDCEYVNREEDMGVLGIRQAKKSYHPIFMIDKYDMILRNK